MKSTAARARETESGSDLVRICLGVTGAVAFVAGCAGVGIFGIDRRTLLPLIAIGLALYAASLSRSR